MFLKLGSWTYVSSSIFHNPQSQKNIVWGPRAGFILCHAFLCLFNRSHVFSYSFLTPLVRSCVVAQTFIWWTIHPSIGSCSHLSSPSPLLTPELSGLSLTKASALRAAVNHVPGVLSIRLVAFTRLQAMSEWRPVPHICAHGDVFQSGCDLGGVTCYLRFVLR